MADPPAPAPTHIWTKEHKLLLCVLSRYFKSHGTKDDETALVSGAERILCRLFSAQVQQLGSDQFLTYGAVRRMIYELAKKGHECWKAVFIDSDIADAAGTWKVACDDILRAGNDLSIRLARRKKDHPIAAKRIAEIKRQLHTQTAPVVPAPVSEPNTDSQPQTTMNLATTRMSSQIQPQKLEHGHYDDYNYFSRVAGRLAFRVFTPSSHSINGKEGCFAGAVTGMKSTPPRRSSNHFLGKAYGHLRPTEESSSFLSITESSLVAVRLALWKSKTGIAKIAILDMGMIATATEEPGRLTPSKAIVNRLHNFKGILRHSRDGSHEGDAPTTPTRREYAYHCMSEWLVWEHISASAIINIVDARELTSFLKSNPRVDECLHISKLGDFASAYKAGDFIRSQKIRLTRRVGQSVGAFLKFLGLDITRTKKLAITMKSTWAIGKHGKSKKAARKHSAIVNKAAYMSGMLEGYVDGVVDKRSAGNETTDTNPNSSSNTDSDDEVMVIDDNDSEVDGSEHSPLSVDANASKIKYGDWQIISDDDAAEELAREPATLERSLKRLELDGFRWKSD